MAFESQSTVALVTCDKGGQHQGEYIQFICLNPLCRNECLICCVCKVVKHKDHQVFPLKTLFDDLEFKSKKLERKTELMVLSEIERAQALAQEGIQSLSRYATIKFQKMEDKMKNFFSNLRNEAKQHFNNRPVWTNEVERLRFESDKDHLELRIQEVLDNIQISEGKIQKINEEFFGSKNTESIDYFVQSFLETLKNIHISISTQYSKLYNPQSQPQNSRKDYFQNPIAMHQIQLMNLQQQMVNTKAQSNKNGDVHSNRNYETASFSSKNIQTSNASQSNSNTEAKQGQAIIRNPTFSGYNQLGEILSAQNENMSVKSKGLTNNLQQQQQHFKEVNQDVSPERLSQNPFLMQQSTVSQTIPNLSQLNQIQFDLQKQILQQQALLQQLQQQTQNSQTFQSNPIQNLFQQQMQPLQNSQLQEHRRNWSLQKTSIESVASSALQGLYRNVSPSPPQRLMYYSSLFQQHVQNQQIMQQGITQTALQKFASQPKIALTPSSTGKNNTQVHSASAIQQQNQQNDRKSNFGGQNNISQNQYYEQDLEAEDLVNQKLKELPKSQERQFRFRFHKEYKHQNIDVFDSFKKAKGSSDNFETRLALISPSVEIKPVREFNWAIKIVSCKSVAYSSPLAIGICLKRHAENSQFQFIGEDKQSGSANGSLRYTQSFSRLSYASGGMNSSTTISQKSDLSTHGCYLLTAAGFIRNHTDSKQDMKKVQVRFDQGDILVCHFNPFRKYLKIKNKNSGEYCLINIELTPGDQLFPCVRISYCQDIVEIIDDFE